MTALDAMVEEMTKPASDMVARLRRTCSSRKISKVFGCDNFGCVYCRAARQIVADAEDIAKQRRSLADMRGEMEKETALADRALDAACGLAAAGGGLDDKNHTFPLKEIRRRLSGFIPSCREVFDWTYPIRRARAAAKDPNHPDNRSAP